MLKVNNYSELDSYLRSVDDQLRKDGVPITGRPLRAISRISIEHNMEFNISFALELEESEIIGFDGDVLTRRIIDWFSDLYGSRLGLYYVSGKSVAIIAGDPYIVNIPIALGDVDLIIDPSKFGVFSYVGADGRTTVNILDSYIGITIAASNLITENEKIKLISEYRINTSRFHKIWEIENYKYTLDVKNDLSSAIDNIMIGQTGYGLSRWHSLQAAEKSLKSVLSCQGLTFPKTHDLFRIIAEIKGFYIDPIFVELVNCQPDVRYDAATSTLIDAVRAHNASLAICYKAAIEISEAGLPV